MSDEVSLRDIFVARKRIAPVVRRTPLVHSPALSERAGVEVCLKLECLQTTGSFKLRGATNKLLSLSDEERARGVVTVSTGNHGRAVAYAARALGVDATIYLGEGTAPNKVSAIRQLDAEVVFAGKSYDEANAQAVAVREERGLTFVDPFDDPAIIAGAGTSGLEVLEDLPDVETVVVPLSGGGLIGGIGAAVKAASPGIRVVGVQMESGAVMYHSLKAGQPITMEEEPTLADALVGSLGVKNRFTFGIVQAVVDEVALVSEDEIASAMAFALREERLVVEGGGAVGLAALLHGRVPDLGKRVAVVVSGGNVDVSLLMKIVGEQSAG